MPLHIRTGHSETSSFLCQQKYILPSEIQKVQFGLCSSFPAWEISPMPCLHSCQIFKPRPVGKIRWKQKYYLFDRALQMFGFSQLKMLLLSSSHTPTSSLTKHQFPADKLLLLRSATLGGNCNEEQHMLLFHQHLLIKSRQKSQA